MGANHTDLLKKQLCVIDDKLTKLAGAIESVCVSDTRANRLTILAQEKADVEPALEKAPAPVKFLPFAYFPDSMGSARTLNVWLISRPFAFTVTR